MPRIRGFSAWWGEGLKDDRLPEAGASATPPPPSDSVGGAAPGAAGEVGPGHGGPSRGPGAGLTGGVAEPQTRLCEVGTMSLLGPSRFRHPVSNTELRS